jgi:hypothetical protein
MAGLVTLADACIPHASRRPAVIVWKGFQFDLLFC